MGKSGDKIRLKRIFSPNGAVKHEGMQCKWAVGVLRDLVTWVFHMRQVQELHRK